MKKTLSLLLAAIMLIGISACGDTTDNNLGDDLETLESTSEERSVTTDSLPADLELSGQNVDILIGNYNNAYLQDLYAEEETGNRISDVVYNNINWVQERLDVTLKYEWIDYVAGPEELEYPTTITSRIMAGDDSMDILFSHNNFMAQMTDGEYFINLAGTKYLDLEKPWYDQSTVAALPADNVHFITGAFSLANIKYIYATYYNNDLYQSLGHTENLYKLVDEGKWTLSKLEELLKDSYSDLNGNNTPDADDRYGLTFGDLNKYVGFVTSLDGAIVSRGNSGYEFAFDSERTTNIMQKIVSFVNENENVLPLNQDGNTDYQIKASGGNSISKQFLEGRALFTCSLLDDASTIVPSIDFSFGLLPYPKWDETQTEYKSGVMRSCFALIPTVASDYDAASAVLEAMSFRNYNTLLPEYCEVSLKVRYSSDNDVSRMYDLCISSAYYDPGMLFNAYLGYPSLTIRNAVSQNDPNWASRVAALKDSYTDKLEKISNR